MWESPTRDSPYHHHTHVLFAPRLLQRSSSLRSFVRSFGGAHKICMRGRGWWVADQVVSSPEMGWICVILNRINICKMVLEAFHSHKYNKFGSETFSLPFPSQTNQPTNYSPESRGVKVCNSMPIPSLPWHVLSLHSLPTSSIAVVGLDVDFAS